MWPNPQFPADLVTITEEILNGKRHFLCSVGHSEGAQVTQLLKALCHSKDAALEHLKQMRHFIHQTLDGNFIALYNTTFKPGWLYS